MKETIMEFAKTPVGVAIICGLFLLMIVLVFLNKTDFGKKISKKAKSSAENAISKVEKCYEDIKETKVDLDKREKELVAHCEEIVACAEEHNDEIDALLYAVLPLLHNKKIDELIEKYKSNAKDRIKDINGIVAEKEKEYASAYEKKSLEIDTKIAELDKIIAELKNSPKTSEKE